MEDRRPQSLSNVLVHVIYSTKNREPFLRDVRLRRELEAHLVGTLQGIECPPLCLRAVADHLHVLCRLSRIVTIARLVATMKTESSKWIKRHSHGTRVRMAVRLCRLLSQRLERRTCETLHRRSGRASPRQDVPRRIACLPAPPSSRVRRTLRVALRPTRRLRLPAPKGRDSKAQVGASAGLGSWNPKHPSSLRRPNGPRQRRAERKRQVVTNRRSRFAARTCRPPCVELPVDRIDSLHKNLLAQLWRRRHAVGTT